MPITPSEGVGSGEQRRRGIITRRKALKVSDERFRQGQHLLTPRLLRPDEQLSFREIDVRPGQLRDVTEAQPEVPGNPRGAGWR